MQFKEKIIHPSVTPAWKFENSSRKYCLGANLTIKNVLACGFWSFKRRYWFRSYVSLQKNQSKSYISLRRINLNLGEKDLKVNFAKKCLNCLISVHLKIAEILIFSWRKTGIWLFFNAELWACDMSTYWNYYGGG